MNLYSQFIHLSRYSRWLPEQKRREKWNETVARYLDFFEKHLKENFDFQLQAKVRQELETAILNLEVMPSMRCLMTAGPALERDHMAGYNCAFVTIDSPRSFDEIMFILLCGTGVGFSVERQEINKLPVVPEELYDSDTTIVVADSKLGWAKALKEMLSLLYIGQVPKWDLSKVRPAGTPLKIFGGHASGPEPLDELFRFCVRLFKQANGRKLNSLECHDLVCKISEVVLVGGVRRAALISLSNLSDERMRGAKTGQWFETHDHRQLANNSVAYTEKPEIGIFIREWLSLYESKSGERGIFNREAAIKKIRKLGRRDPNWNWGLNPCGEIILRSKETCNLSEVVVRPEDTEETLKKKIEIAAIFGTFQSTLTNFRYVSKEWQKNCEEERLLGVSLTGIADNKMLYKKDNAELLMRLKEHAIKVNKDWAKKIGINSSVAVTTIKPSGTVSALVQSSSGIHVRHSPYYIRTVRLDNKDPVCHFMKQSGFAWEPDISKPNYVSVFSFPMKTPDDAICRKDVSAIDQLEVWLNFQKHWCEHNVSCTVYVREKEWLDVAAFVYNHFDEMCGVSFLPYSEHMYKQAPFQECTKEEYEKLLKQIPETIDWSLLEQYEDRDNTSSTQELACSGNTCEIL